MFQRILLQLNQSPLRLLSAENVPTILFTCQIYNVSEISKENISIANVSEISKENISKGHFLACARR